MIGLILATGITISGTPLPVTSDRLTQVKVANIHCTNGTNKALYYNIYSYDRVIVTGYVPANTEIKADFFGLPVKTPRFHQDKGLDCDVGIKLQDLPQEH